MKDEHTYGEKMPRKGRTKVIYKGTFISDRSLFDFFKTILRSAELALWDQPNIELQCQSVYIKFQKTH